MRVIESWPGLIHEFIRGRHFVHDQRELSRVPEAVLLKWLADNRNWVHACTRCLDTLTALLDVFPRKQLTLISYDELSGKPERWRKDFGIG